MTDLYSKKAEQAVLGACMLSNDALLTVSGILRAEDFYDVFNALTYRTMLDLLSAGKPVDLITFQEEAENRGIFEKLGGQPFLAELMSDLSPLANVEFHANIVKQYSLRRNLILTSDNLSRLAADSSRDLTEIFNDIEKSISDIRLDDKKSAPLPVKNAIENAFSKIQDTYQNGISNKSYFSTGLIDLDGIITGFQPGSLNIIAARPSMGKSALALNIAQFGGDMNAPVLIFSLEMTAEQLAFRMLAAQGALENGADLTQLQTGTMAEGQLMSLQDSVNYLAERQIFICEKALLTAADFRAECKRFKQAHEDLALIVVDYLQLMTSGKTAKENRQYETAEISRALKAVAVELNCPVIALSQLSRETEKRAEKKPQLSDLRDSGAIEQDADTVIMLYREDYYTTETTELDSLAEIKVAKNRNGMTGNCKLIFRREYSRFLNYGEA